MDAKPIEGYLMSNNIFDAKFNGLPRSSMYRAWVFPEEFPEERPAMLQNWSDEEKEAFCGVYG